MSTMLAARVHDGATKLQLDTVDVPEPGPSDVVVSVEAAGLPPVVMKMMARGRYEHLPTIPGHEAAGTVVAVGSESPSRLNGRRVRVHPTLSCRACRYCRSDRDQMCHEAALVGGAAAGRRDGGLYARYHDGGLAEYIRVPHWLVDVLPDAVGFDVGAKVHQLGNAVRALRCAALDPGSTLVVSAATGTMGTATIKLAPFFGVGRLVLVGRSARRVEAVRRLAGSVPTDTVALEDLDDDWAANGDLTRALHDVVGDGADAVIDFLPDPDGSGQVTQALAFGGRMVHMGGAPRPLPIPLNRLMHDCWQVIGTRSCSRGDTDLVLDLLASGRLVVDELITHRFSLADIGAAADAVLQRSEPMWMAVVEP